MFQKELEAIKKYIVENLSKRFIKASIVLYTLLVLFVQKPDKGIKFYIDYQKLNTITYKNYYLLLLLNKIFAQIAKAKIFTKIDIQQAFN